MTEPAAAARSHGPTAAAGVGAAAGAGGSALPWLAYGSLAASMTLVGSYVGLSRLLVAVFPVFLLAWLRFGIAAVAMGPWLRRGADEPRLDVPTQRLLFLESLLGNFLFSVFMLYGVAMTSAVAAGVTMSGIPAAVALMSRVFLGERLNGRIVVAIGCAVGGMALLALARTPGDGAAAGHTAAAAAGPVWLGQLLLVAAMLCEASYVVIGKRLTSAGIAPRRISALINLWGLALVTPLGLWQAWQFDFGRVTLPTWGLLLFYALAASMWTVWLWMRGLQRVPAQKAGVFTVMLPVSAATVGVLALGEPFGGGHLAALGLSLAGLLLATWPASHTDRPDPRA
ncbi:MAG: hypothetical protein RLY78_2016 [Pseudomonadota bacterium]